MLETVRLLAAICLVPPDGYGLFLSVSFTLKPFLLYVAMTRHSKESQCVGRFMVKFAFCPSFKAFRCMILKWKCVLIHRKKVQNLTGPSLADCLPAAYQCHCQYPWWCRLQTSPAKWVHANRSHWCLRREMCLLVWGSQLLLW
jgi:hypothetical protein